MKPLLQAEIEWYQEAALGPFSYLGLDLRLTHACESTVCASTYQACLNHGWLPMEIE